MIWEIQQFRYFLAAARYENLTKAAEDLHIAQPALSQSIKRLETELGVSLFDRKNHRIELNEQGKLLKKRLIPILESIDNLKDELWESVYSSERTIYLNFLSASNLITNSIISYRALKPDVQFQVSQLEMTESCDIHIESRIAISVTPPHPQELPDGVVRREYLRRRFFWQYRRIQSLRNIRPSICGSEGRKFHPSRKRLAAAGSAMISAGERIRPRCLRATVRSRCAT